MDGLRLSAYSNMGSLSSGDDRSEKAGEVASLAQLPVVEERGVVGPTLNELLQVPGEEFKMNVKCIVTEQGRTRESLLKEVTLMTGKLGLKGESAEEPDPFRLECSWNESGKASLQLTYLNSKELLQYQGSIKGNIIAVQCKNKAQISDFMIEFQGVIWESGDIVLCLKSKTDWHGVVNVASQLGIVVSNDSVPASPAAKLYLPNQKIGKICPNGTHKDSEFECEIDTGDELYSTLLRRKEKE